MADFLSKAQAQNVEVIELLGYKIEVRGLSIGELVALTKVKKGEEPKESIALTAELIAACCWIDGKPAIPAERIADLYKASPPIFNALNDVVTRVNGTVAGNSKATGKGGRHSA